MSVTLVTGYIMIETAAYIISVRRLLIQHFVDHVKCAATNATELWKITHMGTREIIRIFMFSGLPEEGGHDISATENYYR